MATRLLKSFLPLLIMTLLLLFSGGLKESPGNMLSDEGIEENFQDNTVEDTLNPGIS
ncbi:MAG TPA: hypothetical protein GXZ73_02860, partial [Herbinix luporum]|nr:hypothetical protein [Herbinix luporum]